MRPLNPIRFELKQRHTATVMKNGHIRVESHYYSVPCKYIGKKVNVLYTAREVEVYFRYEKIAVHLRSFRSYGYTTREEHLASQHRFMTDWTRTSSLPKPPPYILMWKHTYGVSWKRKNIRSKPISRAGEY